MPERDYRQEMIDSYHSIFYERYLPNTPERWDRVLDRIQRCFGAEVDVLSRDARILDLPCGVGYVEHVLLQQGFQSLDAVDGSSEQIQIAEGRLREAFGETPAVRFHTSDAARYLESSSSYDAIFMIDFIEHVEKEQAVQLLGLAREALKPGGLLFLRTPNAETPMFGRFYDDFTHETPFTRASLRQCVTVAGLRAERVEFERLGAVGKRPGPIKWARRGVHRLGQVILGRILGVPDGGFSETIICVARRP